MKITELKKERLPDRPGVYFFQGEDRSILYIGKATSLRDRVRSYFSNDLLHTRGKHIVDMVALASSVRHTETDSVLEAVILEAALIKQHQPYYNTREKDDRSFNFVVITNEPFPRVLAIRERTMRSGKAPVPDEYKYRFGPFPHGGELTEALKIIRRIFPYREKCSPGQGKPCFDRQIGLCPGVCTGEIGKKAYADVVRNIQLFFEGKKSSVLKRVEREMHVHAKALEFEQAAECKRKIFALNHIKDVALIKSEVRAISARTSRKRTRVYRIEAYDIAHISGKYTVGVMVAIEDGRPKTSDYRKFKIAVDPDHADDTLHLEEVLRRRFGHGEWPKPDLIVIDGGSAQLRCAERVLGSMDIRIPVVSVVKDDRHKPHAFLGSKELIESYKHGILIGNAESHRFALRYHRQLRDRIRR